MLFISKNRINFKKLFTDFLKENERSYYYGGYFGYDGYDDCGDEYESWWQEYLDYKDKKEKKDKKKGGKKKSSKKRMDIDDDYDNDVKFIYFYPDIYDKKNNKDFPTLYKFDEYLSSEDIEVSETDVIYLMNNTTIHCTTYDGIDGKKHLLCANTWTSLCFKADNYASYD